MNLPFKSDAHASLNPTVDGSLGCFYAIVLSNIVNQSSEMENTPPKVKPIHWYNLLSEIRHLIPLFKLMTTNIDDRTHSNEAT